MVAGVSYEVVYQCVGIPQYWNHVLHVLILVGDFLLCDKWHGISLLEVVSKMFAKLFRAQSGANSDAWLWP